MATRVLRAAFCLAGLGWALPGAAEAPAVQVFGASADLVTIDMVVTDADGRPVSDLRADEVEVYDAKKRQELQFLRFVSAPPRAAPSPSPAADGTPVPEPAAGDAVPSGDGPIVVVVLDLQTMSADALLRCRGAVRGMLQGPLDPSARFMLVTSDRRGLHISSQLTTDRARFMEALDRVQPTGSDGDSAVIDFAGRVGEICDGVFPGSLPNAIGAAKAWVETVRSASDNAVSGLRALARHLAPLPGRKQVVFYSAGYPADPADTAASVVEHLCLGSSLASPQRADVRSSLASVRSDSNRRLNELIDEANRTEVSIYAVDARGLMGDAIAARSQVTVRLAARAVAQELQQRDVRAPQELLHSVSDGTGGKASVNTNDAAMGLRAAVADASGHYLLAYSPPADRKEGRFYPIEVKVSRPGVVVRHRKGYEWLSDAQRSEREMAGALRFAELYGAEGLEIAPAIEAGKLSVPVILPTRQLVFEEEHGEYRNHITIRGALRDEAGRIVGDRFLFTKAIAMKMPRERYEDLRGRENVEVANWAALPKKGSYQLVVVVRHSGGRLATATVRLDVP